MIAPGGPRICGACRCLAHEPKPDCPAPYLADVDEIAPVDEFEARRRARGITSS